MLAVRTLCEKRLYVLLLIASLLALVTASPSNDVPAKVYPGSAGWPAQSDWQRLNSTLSGRLIEFQHPNLQCTNATDVGSDGCTQYHRNIENATWIGENPALTNWPHFAEGNAFRYPSYVVKATSPTDVSTAIRWAAAKNVRVVIKNTGHDFLGRNVGYGALSIWTKHIRGIEWIDKWNGTTNRTDISGKWKGSAIRYGSGHIWGEVREEATKRHHLVVTGAEPTVGAGGGWLLGGGHGPYSNAFGLGVEQVLDFEVVTPTGEILIVNEQQNPDLFWAMRGGGGSTFGIVTRVIYKTYPEPDSTVLYLKITPKTRNLEDQENFYKAVAYMMTLHANMTDFGLSGYPLINQTTFLGLYIAPLRTMTDMLTFLQPVVKRLAKAGVTYTSVPVPQSMINAISSLGAPRGQDTFGAMAASLVEPCGFQFAMGSRLLSRQALSESNTPAILTMLKTVLEDKDAYLLPYSNMPGIKHANRPWNFGLNPAWRTAAVHLIGVWNKGVNHRTIGSIMPVRAALDLEITKVRQMEQRVIDVWTPTLDTLSENHGAYVNEGSPYEKDWKTTFYGGGRNYEQLLAIKRRYDPNNTLWCSPCVGSDVFREGQDGKLYLA